MVVKHLGLLIYLLEILPITIQPQAMAKSGYTVSATFNYQNILNVPCNRILVRSGNIISNVQVYASTEEASLESKEAERRRTKKL